MNYQVILGLTADVTIDVEAGSRQDAIKRVFDLFDRYDVAAILDGRTRDAELGIEVDVHGLIEPLDACDFYEVDGEEKIADPKTLKRKKRAARAYRSACKQVHAELRAEASKAQPVAASE